MARTVPTASNGVPVYKNLHTADCWEGVVFGGESGPVVGVRVQSQPGADPGTPRRRKICIMHDLCFFGGGEWGAGRRVCADAGTTGHRAICSGPAAIG